MTELDRKLAQLPSMSPAQLRALWRECWRRPAPEIGPDLLRRGIAWRLQSRVHGDLPNGVGDDRKEALRVPAAEVDRRVIAGLSDWFRSDTAQEPPNDARDVREQLASRNELADAISHMSVPEQRQLLLDWRVTVQLGTNQLSLQLGVAQTRSRSSCQRALCIVDRS